jgi:hypothetical protein
VAQNKATSDDDIVSVLDCVDENLLEIESSDLYAYIMGVLLRHIQLVKDNLHDRVNVRPFSFMV